MFQPHWIRASFSGIFEPSKRLGAYVTKRDKLGIISTPYDKTIKKILARKDGYIFWVNSNPVVNQGDALVHIGE